MALLNSDEMFDEWAKFMDETRRRCLGRYGSVLDGFDLETHVKNHKDEKDCNSKFNFLLESNRCPGCTTLSLLFPDGEIIPEPIEIESGKHAGKKISVTRYEKRNSPFGRYKRITENNLEKGLPPISTMVEKARGISENVVLENVDSDLSHEIVVSSILNWTELSQVRFLYCYGCLSTNVVNRVPTHCESVKGVFFSNHDVLSIIAQCYIISSQQIFYHGTPSMRFLSFEKESFKNEFMKDVTMSYRMIVQPGPRSSIFANSYTGEVILFLPFGAKINGVRAFVPADVHVAEKLELKRFTEEYNFNPGMNDYKKMVILVVRPTHELFEYQDTTSVSIFDPLQLYMWILVLLCEKNIYDIFVGHFKELLRIIFFADDITRVIEGVREWHSRESPSYDELKALAVGLNFKMRFDALERYAKKLPGQFNL